MRCQHCSYPIFSYTRCCPSCSQAVERTDEAKYADTPQTRIGFSLAHLRRAFAAFAVGSGTIKLPVPRVAAVPADQEPFVASP